MKSRGRGHGNGDLVQKKKKRSQRDCFSSKEKVVDFLSNPKFSLDNWGAIDSKVGQPSIRLPGDTGGFQTDKGDFFYG